MAGKLNVDDYIPAQLSERSNINLDTGLYSGNLGLDGEFYLDSLYTDLIMVEYIDINSQGQREEDGLLIPTLTNDLHWRKGRVLMVGPSVHHTKPGDYVCFPNDKGLRAAKLSYKDQDGQIHSTDNAIFLSEQRLFAKLLPISQ